jgi:hypothetical protein
MSAGMCGFKGSLARPPPVWIVRAAKYIRRPIEKIIVWEDSRALHKRSARRNAGSASATASSQGQFAQRLCSTGIAKT